METKFRKGDRVFDIMYGWGNVINIDTYNRNCIEVLFDDKLKKTYLFDALYPSEGGYPRPVLSFTEYRLEGFTQERPEELPKKGQIVWTRGEFPSQWEIGHFFEKKGNEYRTYLSPSFQGWNNKGIEITTTNPYENEN